MSGYRSLTDKIVEGLPKPDKGQVEYGDSGVPGLRLRVSYGGSKSWIFRKTIDSVNRNYFLGRFPKMNVAAARRKARDLLIDIEAGKDVRARLPRPKAADGFTGLSFATWWAGYLERHVKGRLRTAREVERRAAKWVLPVLGARLVPAITKADISRLLERVAFHDQPARPRMREAGAVRADLSAFFAWAAARLDELERNPVAHAWRPPVARPRDRVLSDAEIAAFWRASGRMPWPWRPGFRLLLLTAARRGEVFGGRWRELAGDMWTLPAERAKNGEPHALPLPAAALAILEGLPRFASTDLWFPARGRPGATTSSSGFTKARDHLAALMAEELGAPAPHFTLHDLRRTAATGLQRLGVPLPVTEAVLNHSGSRGGLVGIYQRHGFLPEKRAALAAWAEEVARIVESEKGAANEHV